MRADMARWAGLWPRSEDCMVPHDSQVVMEVPYHKSQSTTFGKSQQSNIKTRHIMWHIKHPEIMVSCRGFFRQDGVHLSDIGLDIFFSDLQDTIETLVEERMAAKKSG
ncbi:hypothetical protein GDO86_003091 [Hymenochirus boettgeri]|uniref:Uncharacterized protein n=1 Tax=Hymenochirus boettgeri TaxID=247094 RepID=A0A8T2JZW2_9PIPI|nr:hypothetical protein GDO86_003091 [Hymenochirus boettgeri]